MEKYYIVDYLTEILVDFHDRLKNISKVDGINSNLIKIFEKNLTTIKNDIELTGKFGGLLQKIDRQIETLKTVERLPEMAADLEVLREQSIVLTIGAFEVFVSDIFKAIANNDPDYFIWPEKDKKISIDIDHFTSNFTLGDAIITHLSNKQYSFQDLGSIVRAAQDYLGVKIVVSNEIKNPIILGTASRHSIVHRGSKIDKQFLQQTRGLTTLVYKEGDLLKLNDADTINLSNAMESFSSEFIQTLLHRDRV